MSSAGLPSVGLVGPKRDCSSQSTSTTKERRPHPRAQHSKTLPARPVSGDPSYKTWEQDSSRSDSVRIRVWEATPGENLSIKDENFECCHILSDVVELTEEGKEPRIFTPATALRKTGQCRCLEDDRDGAKDLRRR
ncbi:hypothetical protein GCM10007874_66650 [Labrys miyagiensis]|uniref:(S)-ureidoglycine aminohydrolase cupin domain-containing protein n=1 Tax=Labrys miyagiensis TaxID=346912 RepID=A0ABQ6CVE0_9HYPH|nr:hypothetical protein GCM10007874_66650 [Labrys miyagiensis]